HILRMRAVPSVPLAARSALRIRHGASEGYHLMLLDLKAPLKEGDRFPVVLRFRRNGEREVMAWVQVPRDTPAPEHAHHGH
ncbi:MAG: copper chaperone PCu(A)C, partial [Burkholderiaceae bacterium]|nr:copper chaperone PCu(A)C [Burkholderiaceae bacterium]